MNNLKNKQWIISALWVNLGYIHDTINNLKCEKNHSQPKKKSITVTTDIPFKT